MMTILPPSRRNGEIRKMENMILGEIRSDVKNIINELALLRSEFEDHDKRIRQNEMDVFHHVRTDERRVIWIKIAVTLLGSGIITVVVALLTGHLGH